MTEHEAAQRLNLQPGDRVRVTRSAPDYAGGWDNTWVPAMDAYIGGVYEVKERHKPTSRGVPLVSCSFSFPAHVLELVSRADGSPVDRPAEVDLLTVLMGV